MPGRYRRSALDRMGAGWGSKVGVGARGRLLVAGVVDGGQYAGAAPGVEAAAAMCGRMQAGVPLVASKSQP